MPTYRTRDSIVRWSNRELSDAELAAHGLMRGGVVPDGGVVRVPIGMMDGWTPEERAAIDRGFAELRNERTPPTMTHTQQMYDASTLAKLRDAADAAFDKSVADLNGWRDGQDAQAAPGHVADEASAAAAFGRGVVSFNAWRNTSGAQ